jgi:hypothetical protein
MTMLHEQCNECLKKDVWLRQATRSAADDKGLQEYVLVENGIHVLYLAHGKT